RRGQTTTNSDGREVQAVYGRDRCFREGTVACRRLGKALEMIIGNDYNPRVFKPLWKTVNRFLKNTVGTIVAIQTSGDTDGFSVACYGASGKPTVARRVVQEAVKSPWTRKDKDKA